MLLAVHVRRSTVAAIKECQVPHQFIGSRSLKQVAPQGLCLFQESRDKEQTLHRIFVFLQMEEAGFASQTVGNDPLI
jgi:hypothetical protein